MDLQIRVWDITLEKMLRSNGLGMQTAEYKSVKTCLVAEIKLDDTGKPFGFYQI